MGWRKELKEKFKKDFPDLDEMLYFQLQDLKTQLKKDLEVLRRLGLDDLDIRRIITIKKSAIGMVNKQLKKITSGTNNQKQ